MLIDEIKMFSVNNKTFTLNQLEHKDNRNGTERTIHYHERVDFLDLSCIIAATLW